MLIMGFLLHVSVKPFNFSSLTRLWDYRILDCLYSHINILNLKIKKFEKKIWTKIKNLNLAFKLCSSDIN